MHAIRCEHPHCKQAASRHLADADTDAMPQYLCEIHWHGLATTFPSRAAHYLPMDSDEERPAASSAA